jgi:serine/threonine protein kinase
VSNHETHAKVEELRSLLFDAEDSDVIATISPHVESCAICQDRLQALVSLGNDRDVAERGVSEWLTGYTERRETWPLESIVAGAETAPIAHAEEYLNPPLHPEMLGRLGRYEIEREIGSGGMGVVFKAHDAELNRPIAIKVLARHLSRSSAARKRFEREARAAAAVVHEHVVAIHNVESDGETPFLVMQYVAGESLQARVDRSGPLSVPEILRVGVQAASGLAAAHEQGIIHRDVKPVNILLEQGVERVLLTDFGLARTVDDASLTQTGVVAGTPHYMSPEQANGDDTDPRTDLFSLGAVLYFVATGHPPFRADRPMGVLHRICHDRQRPVWQVNSEIPDELSDLIDQLLEKRPTRRPASASQLRESLMRMLQQAQNRTPSWPTRLRRMWRKSARKIIATVGIITIATATSLFLYYRVNGSPDVVLPPDPNHPTASTSREIDIELLREIAPAERAQFHEHLKELDQRLQSLESPAASHFDSSPTAWKNDMQSIHQRLDRLQRNDFEPSTSSQGNEP